MRLKQWLKYLIYIVVIIGVVFLKEYLSHMLVLTWQRNFGGGINYWLLLLTPLCLNIIIGLLFGLEHFLAEMKKPGNLKLNMPKLILLGIPSLIMSFLFMISLFHLLFLWDFLSFIAQFGTNFVSVFQIFLGYVIITSITKEDNEDNSKEGIQKEIEEGNPDDIREDFLDDTQDVSDVNNQE